MLTTTRALYWLPCCKQAQPQPSVAYHFNERESTRGTADRALRESELLTNTSDLTALLRGCKVNRSFDVFCLSLMRLCGTFTAAVHTRAGVLLVALGSCRGDPRGRYTVTSLGTLKRVKQVLTYGYAICMLSFSAVLAPHREGELPFLSTILRVNVLALLLFCCAGSSLVLPRLQYGARRMSE
jgi:hypothetical protein